MVYITGSDLLRITALLFIVKEAVLLNRKLQYVNDHQECFISDYKEQLNNCQKDLCELKVHVIVTFVLHYTAKASVSKPAIETIANMERNTIQELKVVFLYPAFIQVYIYIASKKKLPIKLSLSSCSYKKSIVLFFSH